MEVSRSPMPRPMQKEPAWVKKGTSAPSLDPSLPSSDAERTGQRAHGHVVAQADLREQSLERVITVRAAAGDLEEEVDLRGSLRLDHGSLDGVSANSAPSWSRARRMR